MRPFLRDENETAEYCYFHLSVVLPPTETTDRCIRACCLRVDRNILLKNCCCSSSSDFFKRLIFETNLETTVGMFFIGFCEDDIREYGFGFILLTIIGNSLIIIFFVTGDDILHRVYNV